MKFINAITTTTTTVIAVIIIVVVMIVISFIQFSHLMFYQYQSQFVRYPSRLSTMATCYSYVFNTTECQSMANTTQDADTMRNSVELWQLILLIILIGVLAAIMAKVFNRVRRTVYGDKVSCSTSSFGPPARWALGLLWWPRTTINNVFCLVKIWSLFLDCLFEIKFTTITTTSVPASFLCGILTLLMLETEYSGFVGQYHACCCPGS